MSSVKLGKGVTPLDTLQLNKLLKVLTSRYTQYSDILHSAVMQISSNRSQYSQVLLNSARTKAGWFTQYVKWYIDEGQYQDSETLR